jgi:hypothetical protein
MKLITMYFPSSDTSSSLLCLNIVLVTFSNTSNYVPLLKCETKLQAHKKQQVELQFCIF